MPGPVPRVPAPNDRPDGRLVLSAAGRPDARRAPSLDDRPAAGGLLPARADARSGALRRPKADGTSAGLRQQRSAGSFDRGGRLVRRFRIRCGRTRRSPGPLSIRAVVNPRARSGDVSGSSGAVHRRQVSGGHAGRRRPLRHRGRRHRAGRFLAGAAGGRPAPAVARGPAGPGRPRTPRGLRGLRAPEAARPVFAIPRPPPVPPPPLDPRPLGVPRPSATQTNLQHLPPQYPDKRRGPLDLIGSDPLQACPAASYSPTRSPAQYHRR